VLFRENEQGFRCIRSFNVQARSRGKTSDDRDLIVDLRKALTILLRSFSSAAIGPLATPAGELGLPPAAGGDSVEITAIPPAAAVGSEVAAALAAAAKVWFHTKWNRLETTDIIVGSVVGNAGCVTSVS
jgi:hypothetical protein